MFDNNQPPVDHHSLNQHIAQQAFTEAVSKIATLTGLSAQQSACLLQQLGAREFPDKSGIFLSRNAVLADNEHLFIANLFY